MKIFLKAGKILMQELDAPGGQRESLKRSKGLSVKAEFKTQLLSPYARDVWEVRLKRPGHFYDQLSRRFLERRYGSH